MFVAVTRLIWLPTCFSSLLVPGKIDSPRTPVALIRNAIAFRLPKPGVSSGVKATGTFTKAIQVGDRACIREAEMQFIAT